MAKNRIPDTPEERQVTEIAKLRRELEELKSNQAPTVETATGSVGVTTIVAGGISVVTSTLTPPGSETLLAAFDETWYKDSVGVGNDYEGGWTGIDRSELVVESFNSWGKTNNQNVKHISIFKNNTAATSIDVLFRIQARYFKPGSTAS